MINTLNIFSDERRSVYNILLCIDNPILKENMLYYHYFFVKFMIKSLISN